jgi:hypothetical protein
LEVTAHPLSGRTGSSKQVGFTTEAQRHREK